MRLCAGCGVEVVESSLEVGGDVWHLGCLANPREGLPVQSNGTGFDGQFELSLEDMEEARRAILELGPPQGKVAGGFGLPVYVSEHVPLDRAELDDQGEPTGARESVLCWQVESEQGGREIMGDSWPGVFSPGSSSPVLLVHPDRWREFERLFGKSVERLG